jgi:hypothetical protein
LIKNEQRCLPRFTRQQVCLAAAHEADIVGLMLGDRHGIPQTSGLSPTHEE